MSSVHFRRNLIHQCQIQRPAYTRSSDGEVIATFADVNPTLRCRYVQKQENIAEEGQGFMMKLVDSLLVEDDADVLEDDRVTDIVWNADPSSVVDLGPFTIEQRLGRNSTKAHHISLRLERIE